MADDLIRYDLLVQDALRGVVRKVMGDAAREGLQGEHHFYVSFRTDFPGVRMSQRLREKYPQDMTIVLQHQFWDLGVTEHTFEVGLSFSGVPERLLVPYEAVTGFFDPSVQFGLKFELNENGEPVASAPTPEITGAPTGVVRAIRGAASEPAEMPPKAPSRTPRLPAPTTPKLVPAARKAEATEGKGTVRIEVQGEARAEAGAKKAAPTEAPAAEGAEPGASVVSLDAFRKKN